MKKSQQSFIIAEKDVPLGSFETGLHVKQSRILDCGGVACVAFCLEEVGSYKPKQIQMNIPSNLKYSKDHEWIRVEGDEAYVGITDFAQSQLGDIVFVDVTTEGETLAQGEVFGTIEAVKTVSDAFLPVGGEVLEFNAALNDAPEMVNKDPYGEGWMVKIKMTNPAELDALLSAEDYAKLIG